MASARDAAGRPPPPRGAAVRPAPLWRRLLAWALLLLFCLAAPLALLAVWGRLTLLDADAYLATVQPLAGSAALHEGVVRAVADGAGPGGAAAAPLPVTASPTPAPMLSDVPLASPVVRVASPAAGATPVAVARGGPAGGADLGGVVDEATREVVASPAFAAAWSEANRALQQSLTASDAAGPLALDFSSLAPAIQDTLARTGIDGLARVEPPPGALRIVLLDAAGADRLRAALRGAWWGAILLPILAVALLVGSVWVAPSRLRALRRAGLGLTLAMVVLMLTLLIGQSILAGRAPDPAAGAIAAVLLDRLLQQPTLWALAAALIGLAMAVLAAGATWARVRRRAPAV